jgi:hypothetical protein
MDFHSSTWSGGVAKRLGCYELEITEAVEASIDRGYARVVDVGSADGYFAVGLAMRLPEAVVYSFDTDYAARSATRRLATRNGVSGRVLTLGRCTPRRLRGALSIPAFLLCDCEGYESVLLDPEVVPELRSTAFIVEIHENWAPGVGQKLRHRFVGTHDIQVLLPTDRNPAMYEGLEMFSEEERRTVLSEHRPLGQSWMFCTPRL